VWEGDEHEMFKVQDRTALIPVVSIETLTLIERMALGVGVIFWFTDKDIATNDTSTPTSVSTSTTPLGPITRARARRLTHQVSSLLSSGSSYLENGDTCTVVLLRNNGLDQKGRGIAQAGFGLQDRHDL
jgi:hypothetical protein